MSRYTEILIKPLVTEKTTVQTEKHSRYSFQVALSASKTQIKEAVEKLFDVKVLNVKTVVQAQKSYRTKRGFEKAQSIKKAHLQLRNGQKIEFFKGL